MNSNSYTNDLTPFQPPRKMQKMNNKKEPPVIIDLTISEDEEEPKIINAKPVTPENLTSNDFMDSWWNTLSLDIKKELFEAWQDVDNFIDETLTFDSEDTEPEYDDSDQESSSDWHNGFDPNIFCLRPRSQPNTPDYRPTSPAADEQLDLPSTPPTQEYKDDSMEF